RRLSRQTGQCFSLSETPPTAQQPPLIPAHSASLRAFTPVFDGLWTRVNALMAGMQGQGARNGGPAPGKARLRASVTRYASRGAPRGEERKRVVRLSRLGTD